MFTKKLLIELKHYIHIHSIRFNLEKCQETPTFTEYYVSEKASHYDLKNFINSNRKPTFNEVLFGFIDKKRESDLNIYKKAFIDRRHFSKIRSNLHYRPSKKTVISLALALNLDKKDTDKLLNSAGYVLSDSDTFDLIIQFCLEKKIYNIHDVNFALDYFSLKPLTGVLE